jgi:hypothetical protein
MLINGSSRKFVIKKQFSFETGHLLLSHHKSHLSFCANDLLQILAKDKEKYNPYKEL